MAEPVLIKNEARFHPLARFNCCFFSVDNVVVKEAEVLVVANGHPASRRAAQLIGEDQILIDLVGTAKPTHGMIGHYEGICW